jgi:hypothetical protein
MSGRIGTGAHAGHTHLFILGHTPGGGGVAPESDAYEVEINGFTPNTTVASAPRTSLVTNWGNIFGGKLLAFDNQTSASQPCTALQCYPVGLRWVESLQRLYWGFQVGYTNNSWTSIGFTTLDNPVGPVKTSYGPFRTTAVTQQSTGTPTTRGTLAKGFVADSPGDTMMTFAVSKSGNAVLPAGPNLFESATWPSTSTTEGIAGPEFSLSEYLNYYFQNGINANGTFSAPIREFQFTNTSLTYIFEPGFNPMQRIDPAQNSGVGVWGDESSTLTGAIWIDGTNKDGVVFFAKSAVSSNTNAADCTLTTGSAHEFYRNVGQGSIQLASSSGFSNASTYTLTGGTSGTTGSTQFVSTGYVGYSNAGALYTVGETVTQATTGASSTVLAQHQNDTCWHGCTISVPVTGPGQTVQTPLMIIYDPATLSAVHAGSVTDYAQTADHIVDMRATYGLQTACESSLQAGAISGAFKAGDKLYVIANEGYHPSSCNSTEILIHVFTVNDTPVPAPSPVAGGGNFLTSAWWTAPHLTLALNPQASPVSLPFLPLAAGVAVWTVGSLLSRRIQGRS